MSRMSRIGRAIANVLKDNPGSSDVYVPAPIGAMAPVFAGIPQPKKKKPKTLAEGFAAHRTALGDAIGKVLAKTGPGTYVGRLLQNGDEVEAWLESVGIPDWSAGQELDDNLHVTIAHSVVAFPSDHPDDMVEAYASEWGILGTDDALVLYLDSPELYEDHDETDSAGARWDFPNYRPHLTLTYLDSSEAEAWREHIATAPLPPFALLFGPQIVAPLGRDAFGSEVAKFDKDELRDADGEWASGGAAPKDAPGSKMDHWPTYTNRASRPWVLRGADGSTYKGKGFDSAQQALSFARREKLPIALTYNGVRVSDGMMGHGAAARRMALRTTSGPSFLRRADGDLHAMKGDVSEEARDDHGRWTGSGADPDTSKNHSPERKALRDKIVGGWKISDEAHRERKALIVLGKSGSGKSKAVADKVAKAWGANTVDADVAKHGLPEFDNGKGSRNVHEESSRIVNDRVLPDAISRGDNIVLPKIGANRASIANQIGLLKAAGYETTLALVHVPTETAIARNAARLAGGGHGPSDSKEIEAQNGHPEATFDALKQSDGVAHYVKFDNASVGDGEAPRIMEMGDNAYHRRRD